MSKTTPPRGARTRHDPSLVRRLLAEREDSGETLIDLETRSGIPASTLSSWVRRHRQRSSTHSGFVEVVAAPAAASPEDPDVDRRFEVVLVSPRGPRRLLVPSDVNPADLQRVVAALEESC